MIAEKPASRVSLHFPYIVLKFSFIFSIFLFPVLLGSVWTWQFALASSIMAIGLLYYWGHFAAVKPAGGVLLTPIDRPIAVYLLVLLVSMLFSKIPSMSWGDVYKTLGVLSAFWATLYYAKDRAHLLRLAFVLMFLGASLSVCGLLQFMGGIPKDWWHKPYFLSSTYVNHNHFAGLLVMILPISLGLTIAERDRSKKVLYLFMCIVMGCAFVFSLSRGGLLALSAALVFMLSVMGKRKLIQSSTIPFLVFVVMVVGAVTILGITPIEQRIENIQNMTEEEELSLQFRILTWQGALKLISDPRIFLIGGGPGTFGSTFLAHRPVGFSQRPVHAHNDYLELASDLGIAGLLAVAWLLFCLFRAGFTIIDRDESRVRIGLGTGAMAGILGLLVHGLFDFNFHIPANWVLAAICTGLLFAVDTPSAQIKGTDARVVRWAMPSVLAFVILGAFFLGPPNYSFWEAKQYLKFNNRKSALGAVDKSVRQFPWNAEAHYLRGFITGAISRMNASGASLESIQACVRDFEKAMKLNPYEPYYDFHRARVQAPLMASQLPADLIKLYEQAIHKDPNNAQLAFFCAKDLLEYDDRHQPILRASAESMLRRAIELDPDTARDAYLLLWEHEKDISIIIALHEQAPKGLKGFVEFLECQDLWRYHRKYYVKLLGLPLEENKSLLAKTSWKASPTQTLTLKDFTSPASNPIHFDEMFHTKGELTRKVTFRSDLNKIALYAKSAPALGTYPMLAVKIDGKVQDVHYMDSKAYKNYFSVLRAPAGDHLLTLDYMNDFRDSRSTGEDRNVWIAKIELFETTA